MNPIPIDMPNVSCFPASCLAFASVRQLDLDRYVQSSNTHYLDKMSLSPPVAAAVTGATYYAPSGGRVAAMGGAIGAGAVVTTYLTYSVIGKPYGSYGFLWF
jgi:hypothetical protein